MHADFELADYLVEQLSLVSQRLRDLQKDRDDYPSLNYYLKGRSDALTDIINNICAAET